MGALIVAVAALASCTSPEQEAAPRERQARPPNVLIFVTDDQRAARTLSVMPHTRRFFARGGTRFRNAFATTPLCCPSRASILSGRYSHNHGVTRNELGGRLDERHALPAYLSSAGYRSAISGKYLQGIPLHTDPPYFERWDIFSWGYYDRTHNVNGRPKLVRSYSTGHVGRFAVDSLRRFEREDRAPWLLYVAPNAPHFPFLPSEKYRRAPLPERSHGQVRLERDRRDKPPFVRASRFGRAKGNRIMKQQLRTLLSVDDMVERVVGTLRALGEERDTLAFFMSDNGYLLGEHRLFGKRLPYEPSVRIPLLMRWPGRVPAGTVEDRLVANIDIAPTVLDAAGIETDANHAMDGLSLLGNAERDHLLLEQIEKRPQLLPGWAALRSATEIYIEYYAPDQETVRFREHYSLIEDGLQLVNTLADDDSSNDGNVDALQARLEEARSCAASSCP
jgi:arylsulfatase A-like enzyme